MENIYVFESTQYIGVHLDEDQAIILSKAIHKWLAVKALAGSLDAGADMILQDFANQIEEYAKRM
ncbi:unnamed protein product [marine sediment metagenome]|uniref:Uncharacterized protein n=1 Tax=marine sediment metagenome TaxID=412755 RepID=X1G0H0_9ZZZZ